MGFGPGRFLRNCKRLISSFSFGLRRERRLKTFFRKRAIVAWLAEEASKDPLSGEYGKAIFAFGAANFSHTMRGHAPSMVWAFRKKLARRCMVVLIDEYHTSKVCYRCHVTVMKGTKVPGERGRLHGVRECSLCRLRMNRDINSAYNMAYLFFYQLLQNGERPRNYQPGKGLSSNQSKKRKNADDDFDLKLLKKTTKGKEKKRAASLDNDEETGSDSGPVKKARGGTRGRKRNVDESEFAPGEKDSTKSLRRAYSEPISLLLAVEDLPLQPPALARLRQQRSHSEPMRLSSGSRTNRKP